MQAARQISGRRRQVRADALRAEDFQGGSEDGGLEEWEELLPSLASNSAIRACCSASVRSREVHREHAAAVASACICFCIVLPRAKL